MIIAFDLTKRKSFENVKTWLSSIYRLAQDGNLPKVLVGNKVDLADQNNQAERAVDRSEGQKMA